MAAASSHPPDAPGGRIPGPVFLLILLAALALFITGLVVTSDWVRRPEASTPPPEQPAPAVEDPAAPEPAGSPTEDERDR